MSQQAAHSDNVKSQPLSRFRPGSRGVIADIGGSEPLRQRLNALGICPGLAIHVIRRAPFRGPLEIAVRNIHLGLRFEDADWILIDHGEDTL